MLFAKQRPVAATEMPAGPFQSPRQPGDGSASGVRSDQARARGQPVAVCFTSQAQKKKKHRDVRAEQSRAEPGRATASVVSQVKRTHNNDNIS